MKYSPLVTAFLKENGLHPNLYPMKPLCSRFRDEMVQGLVGEKSSFEMLPTYLSPPKEIPLEKPIIVLDAGGTNLRIALLTFHKTPFYTLDYFQQYPMPGSRGRIGKDEFFDTITEYLLPVLTQSNTIGFCFSYACRITKNRDGELLFLSKELEVDGMEGCFIGASLNESLEKKGYSPKQITVINDSVACMLSGYSLPMSKQHSLLGFVLGTGTNTCYLESEYLSPPTIINMETGGFAEFPQGKLEQTFDQTTKSTGLFPYEKMVGGRYLPDLFHFIITEATKTQLFTPTFREEWQKIPPFSLSQLNDFCENYRKDISTTFFSSLCRNPSDAQIFFELSSALYERMARLVTINIGAVLLQSGHPCTPETPAYIIADGTTFHKSTLFQEYLTFYTHHFLQNTLKLHCNYYKIEQGTLLGSAFACFS